MYKVCLFTMILAYGSIILTARGQADEATYALIVNKNLFSPNRTAWVMNETQKTPRIVPKNVPRIDDKKVHLLGTVITVKKRRAVISTSPRSSRKDTEIYTVGDYLQGYLVKEIEPKKVVLVNQLLNEECILFVKADRSQRTQEKTPLPQPQPPVAGKSRPRSKRK
jgi:hypothetical protein